MNIVNHSSCNYLILSIIIIFCSCSTSRIHDEGFSGGSWQIKKVTASSIQEMADLQSPTNLNFGVSNVPSTAESLLNPSITLHSQIEFSIPSKITNSNLKELNKTLKIKPKQWLKASKFHYKLKQLLPNSKSSVGKWILSILGFIGMLLGSIIILAGIGEHSGWGVIFLLFGLLFIIPSLFLLLWAYNID